MLGAASFGKFMQYRYFVFDNVRGNFLYNLYFVSVFFGNFRTHICPRPMGKILYYLLDNSLDWPKKHAEKPKLFFSKRRLIDCFKKYLYTKMIIFRKLLKIGKQFTFIQ